MCDQYEHVLVTQSRKLAGLHLEGEQEEGPGDV